MSDPKLTDCPACGESALFRKISAVAFRLKGSGWYETDFKSDNKRQLHDEGKRDKSQSDTPASQDSAKASESSSGTSETQKSSGDSKSDTPKSDKKATSQAA